MTTVPPRSPIPEGRGRRSNPRMYSLREWGRAYLVLALLLPLFPVMWFLDRRTLPKWLTRKLFQAHDRYTFEHDADFRIPPDTSVPAYMRRWWRLPRNWAFNVYYHWVLRSDDDRALHDHPWWSLSIVLDGGYYEHEILEGGIHRKTWYGPGKMRFRRTGRKAHRLELETKQAHVDRISIEKKIEPIALEPFEMTEALPAATIFITGPVLRRWGFHDGPRGWVDAYDWDAHCEEHGLKGMRMDGGSDAVVSGRNKI